MCRASCIRSRGFKLAITSEIIGKLGGGDVETIPVSGTASGPNGSTATLATIEIPAGETWLIAVAGTMNNDSSNPTYWCHLEIGSSRAAINGESGASTIATGSVTIRMRRTGNLRSDSFTGHVYAVKL